MCSPRELHRLLHVPYRVPLGSGCIFRWVHRSQDFSPGRPRPHNEKGSHYSSSLPFPSLLQSAPLDFLFLLPFVGRVVCTPGWPWTLDPPAPPPKCKHHRCAPSHLALDHAGDGIEAFAQKALYQRSYSLLHTLSGGLLRLLE